MKSVNPEVLSYPRPLFRRDSFIDLNGEWDFYLEDYPIAERLPRYIEFPKEHKKIIVPFCYQSEGSGINDKTRYDEVWYQKEFIFNHKENERVIFHIGAADYHTYVYVNSKLVGEHKGGYTAFRFDITDFLIDNKAKITIRCVDTYDVHQPRGKQKWKNENFGCWYQEVTGIWKPVWAEIVPTNYLTELKITPKKDGYVDFELGVNNAKYGGSCSLLISFNGKRVGYQEATFNNGKLVAHTKLDEIHYWDLDNPYLYDVRITLSDGDVVTSQFGYRFISTDKGQILLNDKPCFMRLTLEQGYYPTGIYTFKNVQEMIDEINLIVDCGFNGFRMHQKVEDERFYYLCDLLGLIVWSEMPSCYDYSLETKDNVIREWKEVIREHYNHPSIMVWTPLNESWGVPGIRINKEQQEFADELYRLTKEYDKTRLVVSNDGWHQCKTDLITMHNYNQNPEEFKKTLVDDVMNIVNENKLIDIHNTFRPLANGYKYEGQPILIDEFCGIGFNIDKINDGWGYGDQVRNEKEFLERYDGLVKAATQSKNIAGWCMTQITDVYQEINGLVNFDRSLKFNIDEINKINTQKR